MSGLYQKPGHLSTEFGLVKAYSVAGLAVLVSGLVAASFDWPGKIAGLLLIVCAPVLALPPTIAYQLSRGKVKAAAETHKPPPSRTF